MSRGKKVGVKLPPRKYARTKKYGWVITVRKLLLELKVSTNFFNVNPTTKKMK
jgi:hypothetical protein